MVTRCDRLVGRKKKKTHPRNFFIAHECFIGIFFIDNMRIRKITRLQILAVNHSHDPLSHPPRYSITLSFPTLSFHSTQSWKGAGPCTYVHNWHFTVISNSYQRRVLGCKEQWEPDKSVALCSESCPDNRSIGRSIKPIISNLLMGD